MPLITTTISISMDTFPQWVNRKFVEWQASLGKRKTVEEFAIYLGVSRPLLNMWMNGNKKPGRENIKLLAETFGNDIYDVMGLPHPNPYLQVAINNWEFMSEEKQEQIARQIAEEAAKYEAKKITERIQTTSKRGKTRGD